MTNKQDFLNPAQAVDQDNDCGRSAKLFLGKSIHWETIPQQGLFV